MKKRAILCTADTENIVSLAEYLVKDGWEIISAGHTAEVLSQDGVPFAEDNSLIDSPRTFPDYLALYRSILTTGHQPDRGYYSDNDREIHLVCVNMQPVFRDRRFFANLDSSRASFDMRCSSLVQAACKNYLKVLVLTDPSDYREAMIQMKTESITDEYRLYLSGKAFNMVSACTAAAADSLLMTKGASSYPGYFTIPYGRICDFSDKDREPAHATVYALPGHTGALGGIKVLQGRELTREMYIDIDTAWKNVCRYSSLLKNAQAVRGSDSEGNDIVTQFTPASGSVFTSSVKHGFIAGSALGKNAAESCRKMLGCALHALRNGVAASSAVIDGDAARIIAGTQLSAVCAPSFTEEACSVLSAQNNPALVTMSKEAMFSYDIRSLDGGLIIQNADKLLFPSWNIVTRTRPTQVQTDEIAFCRLAIMDAHDDAAAVSKNMTITGMCCNAMTPEDACLDALNHSAKNVKDGLTNSADNAEVIISGSPLPFSRNLAQLADAGIRAILQPGGTDSDTEFIQFCNDHGIAMIFTGSRAVAG